MIFCFGAPRILFRFHCSLLGVAPLIYVAGIIGLAFWLPYRPSIIIPRPIADSFLVGFSPDGNRLAIARSRGVASTRTEVDAIVVQPDSISIWDLSSGQPLRQFIPGDVDRLVLHALTINRSARPSVWWRLVDDPIWRSQFMARSPWKAASYSEDWRGDIPIFESNAFYFSRDGQVLALDSRQGKSGSSVVHWPSNQTLFQLPEFLTAVQFLPDGESLVAVSAKSTNYPAIQYHLSLWNFKSKSESPGIVWDEAFPDDGKHLHSIAMSSDGRFLAESPQPGGPPYGALVRDTTTGEIRFKDADAVVRASKRWSNVRDHSIGGSCRRRVANNGFGDVTIRTNRAQRQLRRSSNRNCSGRTTIGNCDRSTQIKCPGSLADTVSVPDVIGLRY
jgi:hypothetical protein